MMQSLTNYYNNSLVAVIIYERRGKSSHVDRQNVKYLKTF